MSIEYFLINLYIYKKESTSWNIRSMDVITSILTTIKKCWTNYKSTALLKNVREMRSQRKPLPSKLERQTGRYRESRFTTVQTRKHKHLQEKKNIGWENLNCNWWIDRSSMCTTLKVKNFRDAQTWKVVPCNFMNFTFKRTTRFSQWRSKKKTLMLSAIF